MVGESKIEANLNINKINPEQNIINRTQFYLSEMNPINDMISNAAAGFVKYGLPDYNQNNLLSNNNIDNTLNPSKKDNKITKKISLKSNGKKEYKKSEGKEKSKSSMKKLKIEKTSTKPEVSVYTNTNTNVNGMKGFDLSTMDVFSMLKNSGKK
jgi:hypothetical protein